MLLDDRPDVDPSFSRPLAGARRLRPGRVHGGPHRPSPDPGPLDDLPPELAFLVAQGVAPPILRRAARIAAEIGVAGEDALFGLGFPDERYARLLARHLGAPHLHHPPTLAREHLDAVAAAEVGWAPLAPRPGEPAHVFAPRGAALRLLLDEHRFEDVGTYGFAITTRRRFEALLRRHGGEDFRERIASGLAGWDAALSARGGVTRPQKGAALAIAAALCAGLAAAPALTGLLLFAALFSVFAAAVAQRLVVVAAGRGAERDPPVPPLPDRDLPVYTLIVPLFGEARVLPSLVRALDAIDYPAAKLDVKVMLEEGDRATAAAVARLGLPPRYDVIVLPGGHPRTKPRALNAALESARGALVVVYDAEDRPHPGQLRAAAARFASAPDDLACLQARLTVDHADETWFTRLFALDYAALFHAVKPGLAALGLPVPLGGTSNHFRAAALRRVGGWDAWNVTEDIDLGYRLARFGFRVGSLDSDTFEEAPLSLDRWLPQRSRWLKGWMVTLLVHGRDPRRLFRDLGPRSGLSVAVSLVATVLSCLAGPPLLALVAVEGWCGILFRADTPLWWLFVAASAALLAGGGAAALWPAALGAWRMGRFGLAGWLSTLPFYLLLVSAASWRAAVELWWDPQRWNKTEHGLARARAQAPH
ncbi:glycosyltransferase [Lichenibacterium dinghuense]|uniref:glycosyltransferase n=1 Tax=Lichenibacterium dinghuense TaxID=2895977 RepID=UPI001F2AE66F|nr:glycosyltransferase [Lichenibacterium sp. 6Y81]